MEREKINPYASYLLLSFSRYAGIDAISSITFPITGRCCGSWLMQRVMRSRHAENWT